MTMSPGVAHARRAGPAATRVIRVAAGAAARDWAVRVSALTRRAFGAGEETRGLPVPDGAADDADLLAAELDQGSQLWIAVDGDGGLSAALRVRPDPDGAWELHRVAVCPDLRHGGVAAGLIATAESVASAEGVALVWLNAVVERCLPPIYARLGYHVTDLMPNPDKLLSELIMARVPGSPRSARPLAEGWIWPAPSRTISWFVTSDGLYGVAGHEQSVGAAARAAGVRLGLLRLDDIRLAGVDLDRSAVPRDFPSLALDLGDRAEPITPDIVRFRSARAGVAGHVMPRTVEPNLFAVWRYGPGREKRVDGAAGPARAEQAP